ncbi:MAG: hypothetical protein WD749_12735 [Phycisphaerales bacterium]
MNGKRLFYAALLLVVVAILIALISSPGTRVIGIIAAIMLVVGSAAALIWWRLADSLFPGASRKTGQSITLARGQAPPRAGPPAQVVKGFDNPAAPG